MRDMVRYTNEELINAIEKWINGEAKEARVYKYVNAYIKECSPEQLQQVINGLDNNQLLKIVKRFKIEVMTAEYMTICKVMHLLRCGKLYGMVTNLDVLDMVQNTKFHFDK